MNRRVFVVAALINAVLVMEGAEVMAGRTEIPVASFSFEGKGNYRAKPDRRDLFQIIHPWTTSKAGDFGQMAARVSLPADSKPPFTLTFYVMDNNYTGPEDTGESWINRDVRVGHRFRQALVNGEVVWQEDTCLDEVSKHQLVDITDKITPGKPFTLAFRLWEAVDSNATLPGDVYITEHYAAKIATAVKHVVKDRYETKSYWGDIAIYTGKRPEPEEIPWGWRTELKAPPPEPLTVEPASRETASLALEKAELMAGPWAWPVRQGVPLPMGAVTEASRIAILDPQGVPLPADVEKLNTWPDGSVQWALASFTLPAGASGPYKLTWGSEIRPTAGTPANPVSTGDDLSADNGLIRVRCQTEKTGGAGLALSVQKGQGVIRAVAAYLEAGKTSFRARWLTGRWLVRSAQAAALALTGEMVAEDGGRYGSCRLRVSVFAGCPYVRLEFTITNERPEKTFSATGYGLKLLTDAAKPLAAESNWAAVQTPAACLIVVPRWFEHLWPNGIETSPEGIDLALFKPGDERLASYDTHPGEAKTHEIWLAVTQEASGAENCRKLAALVETPPRLDVSARIRKTRVWGELPEVTPTRHADVYAKVEEHLASYFSKCKENIRLFGEYPNWDNFYWNTLHTMYGLYAMTGERKWADWAERSVRHHFDVDICHWQPEKDPVAVVGGIHGYWGDHSDMPCYSLVQNCDGAFDYWNFTGDPDGYDYGVGIAEYIRKHTEFGTSGSSREQGWPILCMLAAWRQTGDEKYAVKARSLVETAVGFEERRRGTYIEVHGSVSYLGPTPFMYGILCTALRLYHLRTGDERAALLIARLASAVYEEMHDPAHSKTLPNIDYYYSPNPYLRGEDGFTPITHLNLNIASAQAYGAYVTRDEGLADIARRTWLAGLDGGSVHPEMAYDLAGVVWWLDKLAEIIKNTEDK